LACVLYLAGVSIYLEGTLRNCYLSAEEIRELCLSFPETEEGFPFGRETLVFKAKGKIFLLMSLEAEQLQFNVKCEPQLALDYRERYPDVRPGYHMNKTHWNTVILSGRINRSLLVEMINHSYTLVSGKNTSKKRKKAVKKGGREAKKN
jgi:predicted DNA-binding protein (MmcQ/YjbR family)